MATLITDAAITVVLTASFQSDISSLLLCDELNEREIHQIKTNDLWTQTFNTLHR